MSDGVLPLVDEYLAHLRARGLGGSSLWHAGRALGHFRRFLALGVGDESARALVAIRSEDLARFAQALAEHRDRKGRGWSESTQEVYFRAVVRFYRYLAKRGKMLVDVTLALPQRRRARRLPRAVPTQDEVRTLLTVPDVHTPLGLRDRAILELFYSTGLRRAEVARLSLYDVDLHARVVRVNLGKGHKDRLVPLGRVAARWLAEYEHHSRPELVRETSETTLFIGQDGGRLGTAALGGVLRRLVRRARLEKNVTCHSLRHAFATHLLQEGASIRPIQAMLGHASIDTTQIYTRLAPTDLARALARFHPLERDARKAKKTSSPPGAGV